MSRAQIAYLLIALITTAMSLVAAYLVILTRERRKRAHWSTRSRNARSHWSLALADRIERLAHPAFLRRRRHHRRRHNR